MTSVYNLLWLLLPVGQSTAAPACRKLRCPVLRILGLRHDLWATTLEPLGLVCSSIPVLLMLMLECI